MSSDNAGSAVPAPTARPAATGTPQTTARPVATVSAAARPAAATVARPVAAAATQARPTPQMRRPPVIAAAATAAPADNVAPPAQDANPQNPEPLPLLRMVCWEVALMVALLAIGRTWLEATLLCTGAAVLLAVTAIRYHGTWASTLLLRWVAMALRRRTHDLTEDHDRQAALLDVLVPGGKVTANELAGTKAGTVSRREELLTVLRPVDTGVRQLVHAALSDALRPDSDEADPDLELQLVLHRGPQGSGQTQPRAWLVIRALREVDVLDDDDLRISLSNALRRTQRKLRRAGMAVAPLSKQEITGTITALTHVGPGREVLRERWKSFSVGPVVQVGLRVSGLSEVPAQHRSTVLERLVASVPGAAVTAAVTTGQEASTVVLRLAAPRQVVVDGAADHLARLAPSLGVRLERLDGLHARAVAASLPIGGVSL